MVTEKVCLRSDSNKADQDSRKSNIGPDFSLVAIILEIYKALTISRGHGFSRKWRSRPW